jgi:hypothetical protein
MVKLREAPDVFCLSAVPGARTICVWKKTEHILILFLRQEKNCMNIYVIVIIVLLIVFNVFIAIVK